MDQPQASSLLLAAALEHSPFGVLLICRQGAVFANASARALIGISSVDALASKLEEKFSPATKQSLGQSVDAILDAAQDRSAIEISCSHADGTRVAIEANLSALEHEGTRFALVTLQDVTGRQRVSASLSRLAFHDSLTGLPNRALFLDRLNQTLHRCKRSKKGFALMLLDLDGFKAINDLHGHEAGDAVLREVSSVLLAQVRQTDTVARLGGDEFTVILEEADGCVAALHIAEKVHLALADGLHVAGILLDVGVSIGIAAYPEHADNMHGLMVAADAAMYDSKRNLKGTSRYRETHRLGSMGLSPLGIHWSADLEQGVAWIDDEHRSMVDHINGLVSAFSAAEEPPVIRRAMDHLIEFITRHFAREEAHMAVLTGEEQLQHRNEHQHSLSELLRLRDSLEKTGLSQTIQVIRDWLLAHIRHADRQLCSALLQTGSPPGDSA